MSATSPPSYTPTLDDQSAPPVKRITTDELLEGRRIIEIVHGDKVYRLRGRNGGCGMAER